MNKFELEDGRYGPKLRLKSAWSGSIGQYMIENGIDELELNTSSGWKLDGGDLSFLEELPFLRGLTIIGPGIPPVEPIHKLINLRLLKILTHPHQVIRFPDFQHLEDCCVYWDRNYISLLDCTHLKRLFIDHYKGTELAPFLRMTELEDLGLTSSPIASLCGLGALKRLRKLRLTLLRKLDSLAGLEEVSGLEDVWIQDCKGIRSICQLGSLANLRRLQLENIGEIESLRSLAKLDKLEMLLFLCDTKVLDGDLSFLAEMPSLKIIGFANRRSYSHTVQEVEEVLEARIGTR